MADPDPDTWNGDNGPNGRNDADQLNGNGGGYDDTNGRGETNGRNGNGNGDVIPFPNGTNGGPTDGNGPIPTGGPPPGGEQDQTNGRTPEPVQAGFGMNTQTLVLAAVAAMFLLPLFDRDRERAF